MDFKEFKNLVKERKRLKLEMADTLNRYKTGDAYYLEGYIAKLKDDLLTIENKLKENATKEYYVDFADIDFRLENEMTVSSSEFKKAIKEYFGKSKEVGFDLEDYPLDWYLTISGKEYKLNMSSNDITLSVLHTNNVRDASNKLLKDYPALEEIMWGIVENEVKAKNRNKQKTLIERITEKKKEIDFLCDKKAIENRVGELMLEREEDIKKYKELLNAEDNIEF